MASRTITLKPGDVFAVPRIRGGYYYILHLDSNRFGEAFGLFRGHHKVLDATANWHPIPLPMHIYTGTHLIKSGRWQKLIRREDLRELFQTTPEIYHSKVDNLSNSSIGPYGSAETPAGELRDLSESESTSIGLDQGTYHQIMLEEQVEEYLHRLIG